MASVQADASRPSRQAPELRAGRGLREGLERWLTTDEAVSPGIRATVTSAAAVMIGVFSIAATLSSRDFKEMGVGPASAVRIDATIVRAVLPRAGA